MGVFQNRQDRFEIAYRDYADMLYRVALSYLSDAEDAEDAVHDTFVKFIRHTLPFKDESYERAWLIRVTVNRCKDMLKKRKNHLTLDYAEDVAQTENGGSEVLVALRHLDEKYRLCVELHYLEGFSVEETAVTLGVSVSAVKMRLARGRQMLKEILEGEQ